MENTTRKAIAVYTEATPNPETLKFVTNISLLDRGSAEFLTPEEASPSPLAQMLFKQEHVKSVFIAANFVTVTRDGDAKWVELIPVLRDVIRTWMMEGHEVFTPEGLKQVMEGQDEEFGDDLEGRICALLEKYVKPAVEMDGGAIHFRSFDEGVVKLELKGACSGCPSSMVTLKTGIEGMLKRMIPEVNEVVAYEG